MFDLEDLTGLWRRNFIAWPDGRRDETTCVNWMQAKSTYIDLRQPPWPSGRFTSSCLHGLSMADCETLAIQQGFAGVLERRGAAFEWVRIIDFQPPQAARDIGRLFWQDHVLVEEGVESDYVEHWHRDPAAAQAPHAALHLTSTEDARRALLLRAGNFFMFARGRRHSVEGLTLAMAVSGAASLHAPQLLVDFEISFGCIKGNFWQIARSSLPYRVGANLCARPQGDVKLGVPDVDPAGNPVIRTWEITAEEGDISMIFGAAA